MALLRLPRRREGAERRGDVARPHVDLPRHLLRARPQGRPARPKSRRRRSIDDFVIKLRIVRFLRTPEYDELFAGRSDLGDGVDRRHGRRRPAAGDQDQLPLPADALQPRARRRSRTSPSGIRRGCPSGFRRFAAKVAIDTSSIQFESDEIMRARLGRRRRRSPAASRRCAMGKQMQFFGARANLAKCLLYAINGGRDEVSGEQVAPAFDAGEGRLSRLRRRRSSGSRRMMDWLAGVYVSAMNVIHYMHDKYAYERIEMALHDYAPLRTMAFGIAGMSVVADSLSAIKHAKVKVDPRRDRPHRRL